MEAKINDTLGKRGLKQIDQVRYLSLDHIVNIALAEWLQKKEKQDEKEERQKNFQKRYSLEEIQNQKGIENEENETD